jgi:hypothetical protein
MFQHGLSNLELASIILCLLKANRSEGRNRQILLLTAGFFCGLLPGTRPPCLLFSIATIVYSIVTYRREAVFLLVGCLSFVLSTTWNIYYFGFNLKSLIFGGYLSHAWGNFASSSYKFSLEQFLAAFPGLTISPSRGLFIFSPVLLFSLHGTYKVLKLRHYKDEALLACLSIVAGAVFLQYCFYSMWKVGPYGSRFTLDIVVPSCYLLAYSLSDLIKYFPPVGAGTKPPLPPSTRNLQLRSNLWNITLLSLFFILTIFSTSVQAIGAFGGGEWRSIPTAGFRRIWEWRDSEIERSAKHLYFKIFDPIEDSEAYLAGLGGSIEQVTKLEGRSISSPLVVRPSNRLVLEARVKNTGTHQWFGYETGMNKGVARIVVEFFNIEGQKVSQKNELFVSGMPKSGETTAAIGIISFPSEAGRYKAVFQLIANKIGEFPSNHQPFELAVEVIEK